MFQTLCFYCILARSSPYLPTWVPILESPIMPFNSLMNLETLGVIRISSSIHLYICFEKSILVADCRSSHCVFLFVHIMHRKLTVQAFPKFVQKFARHLKSKLRKIFGVCRDYVRYGTYQLRSTVRSLLPRFQGSIHISTSTH